MNLEGKPRVKSDPVGETPAEKAERLSGNLELMPLAGEVPNAEKTKEEMMQAAEAQAVSDSVAAEALLAGIKRGEVRVASPETMASAANVGDPLSVAKELEGLEQSTISPESMSLAECERILGPNFLGPNAYLAAFGEVPTDIPPIHLTSEELQQIKDRGEELSLMQAHFNDGTPITVENMRSRDIRDADGERVAIWLMSRTSISEDGSRVLLAESYKFETPRSEWRIVSAKPIGIDKRMWEQRLDIKNYLEELYPNDMPQVYQEALAESLDFHAFLNANDGLNLKIRKLLLPSASEAILHGLLRDASIGKAKYNVLSGCDSVTRSQGPDIDEDLIVGRTSRGFSVGTHNERPGYWFSPNALFPSRSVDV